MKIISTMLFLLAITGITAQDSTVRGLATTYEGEIKARKFEVFAKSIVLDEDFNYRKELKRAKLNHTLFHFSDTSITKIQVLRHFKRAARKSESSDEFVRYFQVEKLFFINALDYKTVLGIYGKMHGKTINGYLNMLELMCSI